MGDGERVYETSTLLISLVVRLTHREFSHLSHIIQALAKCILSPFGCLSATFCVLLLLAVLVRSVVENLISNGQTWLNKVLEKGGK